MSGTVVKASKYSIVRMPVTVVKAAVLVPLAIPLIVSRYSAYFIIGQTATKLSIPLETNYKITLALDLDTDYRTFRTYEIDLETDYKINAKLSQEFTTDFKVQVRRELTTSYVIEEAPPLGDVYKELDVDYKITVAKELTVSYNVNGQPINIDLVTDFAVEGLGVSLTTDYQVAFRRELSTDYKVKLFKDLETDYEIEGEWKVDLVSSYKIALNKSLETNYKIANSFGELTIDFRIGQVGELDAFYIARLPQVPVREAWLYSTKINTMRNGKEQRMSMRRRPRVTLAHDYVIENAADFRHFQQSLLQQRQEDVLICQHAQAVPVEETSYGATTVYCRMEDTDIRAGEHVAFFNIGTEESALRVVDTIASDHFTTETGMPFDIGRGCVVMPVRLMRFADGSALSMRAINGTTALTFEDATSRDLTRAGYFAGLDTFDGYTILTRRPLADDEIGDAYSAGFVTIDLSKRLPASVVRHWPVPVVTRSYSFNIERGEAFDYWREFADTVRGSWKAFLMPTFRPDLVAVAFAANNLTIEGDKLDDLMASGAYKRLMITTDAGTDYFVITSAIAGDGETVITLDNNISGAIVQEISFVNLVRITDDVFAFEHRELTSKLTLNLRVIQQ